MTRQHFLPVTLTCLALVSSTADAGDWTEFRGPTRQGHSSERGLPARWSDTENVAWKVPVPGKGWSSPIVYDGRLFLTTAVPLGPDDRGDQSLRVLCYDTERGSTVWNVEAFVQREAETDPIHSKNSHASPTPLTDGQHLYVHFGTNGTACLTLAGKIVWRTQELKYAPRHGTGGSPALVDDLLVISCDGTEDPFVVALDRRTGKIRWNQPRPPVANPRKFSFTTPLVIDVDGRKQAVSPGTDVVIAYDPQSGTEMWRVDYDGYSVVPRPIFAHGLVYVCTGWSPPKLLAIRPTGKGNVTRTHVAWQMDRGVPNTPSLLLVGDELYMVSDAGVASCIDAKTGRVHWQRRLGGAYSASPVFADGKIYFQSEQGDTSVIRPGREFAELARNRLGERTLASMAVADGSLFLRSERQLYRISSPAR